LISKETVQDILDAAQIEQVVGDFVQLKKRGSNLLGLCPFHNEKTPSFTVSPSKGIYKCFGCGKAGNSVNFIMEHEKYSYPEALKYLANKYNIEIEEHELTPEEKQADTERESLFSIHSFARDYFIQTMLNTEEGKAVGHTYFLERGFREDIIQKFQLGYSTSEWDGFTKHALTHGYKEELLIGSGLTLSKEGKLYDRFRERVIFPIHNLTGKVIGFGGRILTSDKTKPKYVNSPESEIYNKSKSLYGIFYARASIVSKDNCFLVEGYTDVISLHQAGIENVVASSGTSLTTEQIRLISKFTKNITILYDGDPAGIKASFRGIDMILEQGMNVRIVLFPDGEDPDSYARKHRSSDIEAFIATSADDFIAFKARLLLAESNNDPIKKASLIHEIIESISIVSDPIIRSLYVKECASIMNITESTLVNELNKVLRKKFIKSRTNQTEQETLESIEPQLIPIGPEPVIKQDDCSAQELDVIRLLLLYGDKKIDYYHHSSKETEQMSIAKLICDDLSANQVAFDDPVYQHIFSAYIEGLENNSIPSDKDFFTNGDPAIATTAINIITPRYELSPNWGNYRITVPHEEERLQETSLRAVLSLLHRRLSILINKTQAELKELPSDTEEYADLMSRNLFLLKARNGISNRLGRVLNN